MSLSLSRGLFLPHLVLKPVAIGRAEFFELLPQAVYAGDQAFAERQALPVLVEIGRADGGQGLVPDRVPYGNAEILRVDIDPDLSAVFDMSFSNLKSKGNLRWLRDRFFDLRLLMLRRFWLPPCCHF